MRLTNFDCIFLCCLFKLGAPNYGQQAKSDMEGILSVMKKYIYKTLVELIEWNICQKNHIM